MLTGKSFFNNFLKVGVQLNSKVFLYKLFTMLKLLPVFRIIALLEGVSYVLLFIATPIKYLTNDPQYVKMLGMPHGILFMAYIVFAVLLSASLKWNTKTLCIVLLASIIPFGTFYVDKKYLAKTNA